MRHQGKEYILTSYGSERIADNVNEIGEKILGFVKEAPIDCDFARLIKFLQEQYDIDEATLENDVRQFLELCIDSEVLTDLKQLKVYGMDLSITNQCNASCVYCATPRIKNPKRFLSLDEVRKLIADLGSSAFRDTFGRLTTVEFGGLSEPLLHPQAMEILRVFRIRYPTPHRILYTNAMLLTADRISTLLQEDLITSLVLSIDGLDDREHRAAKGIPYSVVESNVKQFIRLRKEYGANCRLVIQVLPYAKYRALVHKQLKRYPLNAPEDDLCLEDHTDDIVERWKAQVAEGDEVRAAGTYFQLRGEYRSAGDSLAVAERDLNCPWFDYVAHSVSVTSNGDVLICCNDFYKENVLGNYLESSLYDVVAGPRRAFLVQLARNNLAELPSRCRQKKYCQFLSFGEHAGER